MCVCVSTMDVAVRLKSAEVKAKLRSYLSAESDRI